MTGRKPEGSLRKGWTTGACATAAALAAYEALLTGQFPDPVTITLPRGEEPTFDLSRQYLADGSATAGVIKDAGDDPDVTHGAEVIVEVRRGENGSGVIFKAGEGVGMVTLAGLPVPVGEPAINPGPRAMIESVITGAAERLGGSGDVSVTVSIPDGDVLAEKTMNGRLGIRGGLSVLGTTGVVIPYSCASWIHSIHRGIDVARAAGIEHIAAATGSTSESAIQAKLGLDETALIDMGDFAGGMLKYLRKHPVPRLTIAGGFGKLTKLAQGHMDLHSSRSSVDLRALAEVAAAAGADEGVTTAITGANTAMEALELARQNDLPLADLIARQAREAALATLSGDMAVEVTIFDRKGIQVGHAAG